MLETTTPKTVYVFESNGKENNRIIAIEIY